MRILLIRAGLLGIVLAAAAAPARADATLFGGVATSATGSTSGPAFGVAFGRCPGIFGFELEYAGGSGGSGAQTVAVNALVQTTLPIHRMQFYGIGGLDEARAYLAHPVLGPRLAECALAAEAASLNALFGSPDDLKFVSSMTLFAQAADDPAPFRAALDRWSAAPDAATLALLGR